MGRTVCRDVCRDAKAIAVRLNQSVIPLDLAHVQEDLGMSGEVFEEIQNVFMFLSKKDQHVPAGARRSA